MDGGSIFFVKFEVPCINLRVGELGVNSDAMEDHAFCWNFGK